MLATISSQDLYQKIKKHETLLLTDVRDSNQYSQWHIDQSINIPLDDLSQKIHKLPKNRPIVTICNRGNDSAHAAKMLRDSGFYAVTLAGGMKGWNSVYDVVVVQKSGKSPLKVLQIKRLGKGCLTYLVILPDKKSAVIIDPTNHIKVLQEELAKKKLRLLAVIDTHIHADHTSGGKSLADALSVPYLLPQKSEVSFAFKSLEKELPQIVQGVNFEIIATPGHTVESISILIDHNFLFTGDTLFIDGIGRSDLGEKVRESAEFLYQSVTEKLFKLDQNVVVLPAHYAHPMVTGEVYARILKETIKDNPIRRFRGSRDFAKNQAVHQMPIPPNYHEIKNFNMTGIKPSDEVIDELELGGNSCVAST